MYVSVLRKQCVNKINILHHCKEQDFEIFAIRQETESNELTLWCHNSKVHHHVHKSPPLAHYPEQG
jgi:hypothetical protein